MNNLIEKLENFKSEIEKAPELNESLENLISIDLYDFIHDNETLKKGFYAVFDYFKNLKTDKTYTKTEYELFKSILTMANFNSDDNILKFNDNLEEENRHRMFYKLKGALENNKDDIELKDLIKKIKDKNNYYKLGSVDIYSVNDSFRFTRTSVIRQQYNSIGYLFSIVSWEISKLSIDEYKKFDVLYKKFQKILDEFDNLIYRIPLRMKLRNFEDFFKFCIQRYPREDYRAFYNMRGDSQLDNSKILKNIKNDANIVLNELMGKLSSGSHQQQANKIFYDYSNYDKSANGHLKIGEFKISFDNIPAMIINFFFENSKITDDYKTYKDFNEFIKEDFKDVISNDFRLRIDKINNRVRKETKQLIKTLIEKGKTKKQEANSYRWNRKIF